MDMAKAIQAWRNVDLTALMPSLDAAASELVAHQRDSLVQRKDLAQKTKEFRKLDDAAKLAEIKSLLKEAYQTFIDGISNQSKAISSAFLQVYSPLSEAPDPYPLLEASIDSLVTAEETLPKLTEENKHLQDTTARLTAQLEETESRLEQERTARQALEATREENIKEIETTWSAVLEEKTDNWEAKERSLEEKVENQDRLLKELKASYEVSQRLSKGEDGDVDSARASATAAELEIVSSELDRTNMRLAEVEARNEQLRLELAQSASHSHTTQTLIEEEPAFLRLQSENSSLLRKVDAARFEKDSEKRKWEGELRLLGREIATLKSDRDTLRDKVHKWGDYENVKRELEVLKTIEFATGDDDEAQDDSSTLNGNGSISVSKGETLEQLLLARNKKLSNELTILRVSHQDLQSRLSELQEELSKTNMILEQSQNLTQTLENDLLKVQQEAAHAFDSSAMSVAGTYTSRYPHSSYPSRARRSSPTSSIISGFAPTERGPPSDTAIGGGSGILPMVTAQRDRFKKKISELETELQKSYSSVSKLRSEVASLQKDNLNLYERTRYVSNYSNSHARHPIAAGSSSAYGANPNPSTVAMDSPSVEDRYRPAYEQKLSPFAAFRGRESNRALKRMSLPERVVFRITRVVLATRTSRNTFAAYCLALHLLVFVMLYWMGSMDAGGHAVQFGKAAAGAAVAEKAPAPVAGPEVVPGAGERKNGG